jgi:UDP-N-acetylglucosamine 2-epimerase (non-hydrolysing)
LKRVSVLVVLGTRPEAIKLAPVISELRNDAAFEVTVCNTEQHKQLAGEALGYFGIRPDLTLDVMTADQELPHLNACLLQRLAGVMADGGYDGVVGQGDTMTTFAGALAAFYQRIPFFHVEAGIRTHDLEHPFPEEMLRQCIARMATLHFAPTESARRTLLQEGISDASIFVTGNTVVDALHYIAQIEHNWDASRLRVLDRTAPKVLVTVHRRENHGANLGAITAAVLDLARAYPQIEFVLPVHPNPNVRAPIEHELAGTPNIHLTDPLSYPELVQLMRCSVLILTDSGGIQEEAPAFGVPLLVMREKTERNEGVQAGCAELVGSDRELIVSRARALLDGTDSQVRPSSNPYGDGQAARRIARHLRRHLGTEDALVRTGAGSFDRVRYSGLRVRGLG